MSRASTLHGTGVVPGIGSGPVIRPMPRPQIPEEEPALEPAEALHRFRTAAEAVAARLTARAEGISGAASEVLVTTAELARDRGLVSLVDQRLGQGNGLYAAIGGAVDDLVTMFTSAGGLMAERVTDLLDVRDRIVAELSGQPEPGISAPPSPAVLCAEDLAPADTAGLDPALIVAIATSQGGPTSHTSIISRQLGIPCVVGVDGLDNIEQGTVVLVDGATGDVVIEPEQSVVAQRAESARQVREAAQAWAGPGSTSDGHRVEILANVHDGASARAVAASPVEGVGLFRTEVGFLDRDTEPSVEEQTRAYREVLEPLSDRKVVVRTLDAGSDKPLAFATIPGEPNPALGVRGMRLGLRDEGLLDRQLEAIAAAASPGSAVWVMAPMVATEQEASWFAARVRTHGLVPGVMVEIPSAALQAERLLRHVDFLSIGTNDLSQYTFAADRMTSSLAILNDPWQPALLQLIAITARAGQEADKPVGVCGEAAADPLLACVLTGLGVTSLSSAATAAPLVGARLSTVTLQQCQEAAKAALAASTPEAAREAARALTS